MIFRMVLWANWLHRFAGDACFPSDTFCTVHVSRWYAPIPKTIFVFQTPRPRARNSSGRMTGIRLKVPTVKGHGRWIPSSPCLQSGVVISGYDCYLLVFCLSISSIGCGLSFYAYLLVLESIVAVRAITRYYSRLSYLLNTSFKISYLGY
jgi:hypothetical protein